MKETDQIPSGYGAGKARGACIPVDLTETQENHIAVNDKEASSGLCEISRIYNASQSIRKIQ